MGSIDNVRGVSLHESLSIYEQKRTRAKIDLVIKNIFLTVVVLINLGSLATAFAFITMYCPIKTEPVFATSFIVGVLGGMISLKIPTLGITNYNLSQYLNPVTLLGRAMAYAFFGPTLLAMRHMDRTPYGDASVASQISGELNSQSFEYIAEHYGSNFSNLIKYGFISKDKREELQKIYEDYIPLKMQKEDSIPYTKNFKTKTQKEDEIQEQESVMERNPHLLKLQKVEEALKIIEDRWVTLKKELEFPEPVLEEHDYTKRHVRMFRIFSKKLNSNLYSVEI